MLRNELSRADTLRADTLSAKFQGLNSEGQMKRVKFQGPNSEGQISRAELPRTKPLRAELQGLNF